MSVVRGQNFRGLELGPVRAFAAWQPLFLWLELGPFSVAWCWGIQSWELLYANPVTWHLHLGPLEFTLAGSVPNG